MRPELVEFLQRRASSEHISTCIDSIGLTGCYALSVTLTVETIYCVAFGEPMSCSNQFIVLVEQPDLVGTGNSAR